MHKVKQSDLKGQIKDFPIEVVQKMVEKQVHQGNKADVKVFQIDKGAPRYSGGFKWSSTKEGPSFWIEVIDGHNFSQFFKKYPKSPLDLMEEHSIIKPLGYDKMAGGKDNPPLGVMPKFIWDRKRISMLKEAIKRYLDENKAIPNEWITEYNELVK